MSGCGIRAIAVGIALPTWHIASILVEPHRAWANVCTRLRRDKNRKGGNHILHHILTMGKAGVRPWIPGWWAPGRARRGM
eukprot:4853165-Pleurochrysis_carterae.AAC.5